MRKISFLLASFFLSALCVYSQDAGSSTGSEADAFPGAEAGINTAPAANQAPPAAANAGVNQVQPAGANGGVIYVIAGFEFDIIGRTRPSAILDSGDFRIGQELKGQEGLDSYIRQKTQNLVNMRVLRETVELVPSVGARNTDGSYPVTITIRAEDTNNIVVLPVPYYSTNDGLEISLRARDYNFLGTMNPLRLNLSYGNKEGKNSFSAVLEAGFPFTALGYKWNFKFENAFTYRPDVSEQVFFQNTTGLSVDIPVNFTTFTVGFDEKLTLNEENAERYRPLHEQFQKGPYMSSRVFASWKIPTGLKTESMGNLTYTIDPWVTFNHEMPDWPLAGFRKGPFAGISHSLGIGRVDWYGNFRKGLSFGADNSYSYDFSGYNRSEQEPLSVTLAFRGEAHTMLGSFAGLSARVQSRNWFSFTGKGNYSGNAGDVLRGIRDDSIKADSMLSLNTEFPFRVLVFEPSKWFSNDKMSLFNFELHLGPTVDFAYYNDPESGSDIAVAGGLEFTVFPERWRSLYLRLSVGTDIPETLQRKRIPGLGDLEISFGMGHFY